MKAVPQFASAVLADIIRRQPLSPGKVSLAWQIAAGPQLARMAEADFQAPATVRLRPKDARWAAAIERSRAVIAERLGGLLEIPGLDITLT
ncbi:MAG TPA: hypothetical protein VK886_08705 [Vicinamibacterales bacterium]|nr:hypothetical protein [Vicinamibacterales bacterium]